MSSKKEVPNFNSDMLALARELRGLNQSGLAKELNVSQSRISKIEMKLLPCDEELLEKICLVLRFPESFFVQAKRVYGLPVSVHGHHRKKTIAKTELSRVHAQMNVFTFNIEDLTSSISVEPRYFLPSMPSDEFSNPSEIAKIARRAMLVKDGPCHSIADIIESAGVIIIKRPFGTDKVDGLSLLLNGIPPLIFIRDGMPGDRENITLAHELGHLIMHYSGSLSSDIEDEAWEFAAEFLMPENEIKPSLRNLSLPRLVGLKQEWRVSMQALIMRAKKLKCITESQYKSLFVQLSKSGYRRNEPIEIPQQKPELLNKLIKTYLEDLDYSPRELASVLKLNDFDFQETYLNSRAFSNPRVVNINRHKLQA